jgi:predicted RNA-binding Zn-ribbon protein involved in translation (DUF1610 family)
MADKEQNLNPNQNQSLQCPVCGETLAFLIARGRKSGKPFLMVKCLRDGRHFRGNITAVYNGDDNNDGCTSNIMSQVINK